MDVNDHFTLLVYPFRHDLSEKSMGEFLKKLGRSWKPFLGRFKSDQLTEVVNDTYFFLPSARRLLFPEVDYLDKFKHTRRSNEAKRLAGYSASHYTKVIQENFRHQYGVLKFTYDQEKLRQYSSFTLGLEGRLDPTLFSLHWVDLAMFPQNVGILTIKVSVNDTSQSLPDLISALSFLRQIHPYNLDQKLVNWSFNDQLSCKSQDLVDFFLQGILGGFISDDLTKFVQEHERYSLMRLTGSPEGYAYGFYFRHFTYIGASNSDKGEVTEGFDTSTQQALYELGTCTLTKKRDFQPHPLGLEELFDKSLISIWKNWQGLALHDAAVFIGFEDKSDGFVRNVFKHNVDGEYFHLYQLTLYQKIRLSLLTSQLIRSDTELRNNLPEARKLWDAFTMFRNHFWFAEVTPSPQGNALFRRFQSGMGIKSLYDIGEHEVRELQKYYENKSERLTNVLLSVLTFIGLPTSIISILINVMVRMELPNFWETLGIVSAGLYIIFIGIWFTWHRYGRVN